MESTTAGLGRYIAECRYGRSDTPRIFKIGFTHRSPILKKNCVNRVIFYPGSFNPPHRGHEALLRHAFENTQDINVIATIILPRDDDALDRRYGLAHLTKEQRVRLWQGDENTNDLREWSWVFDRNTHDWKNFRDRLMEKATRNGFQLEFLQLAGPDHLRRHNPVTWNSFWQSDGLIVSDVARSADFTTTPGGKLSRILGCVHWKLVVVDAEVLRRCARQDVKSLQLSTAQLAPPVYEALLKKDPNHFSNLTEKLYAAQQKRLKKIRFCHPPRSTQKVIRFIPACITSRSDFAAIHNISATKVRRVIQRGLQRLAEYRSDLATFKKELEPLVLNSELLVQLYVAGQFNTRAFAAPRDTNTWNW